MTDGDYSSDDNDEPPGENEPGNDPPTQASSEAFCTKYNEDESPSSAVISAVSAVKGVEPIELECLSDCIDPEALDALMGGPTVIEDGGTIRIEFQ